MGEVQQRRLSSDGRAIIAAAHALAARRHHEQVEDEHLLLALLRHKAGNVPTMLIHLQPQALALADTLEREIGVPDLAFDAPPVSRKISARTTRTLERAITQAEQLGDTAVAGEHLLLALGADPLTHVARLLEEYQISQDRLASEMVELRHPLPDDTAGGQTDDLSHDDPRDTITERLNVVSGALAEIRSLIASAPDIDAGVRLAQAQRQIATLERQNLYLQELLLINQDRLNYLRTLLDNERRSIQP